MGELSSHLKDVRMARGHSQAYAAGQVGVSQSALSKWENDDGSPTAEHVPSLARYLAEPQHVIRAAHPD